MSEIINDTIQYDNLHVVKEGFVGKTITFSDDYQGNTIIVNHNLGYVPIAHVYYDSASGSRDPASVTATEFTGAQIPYFVYQLGFGLGEPVIYRYIYYTVDKYDIYFNIQQWGLQDASQSTHFFKFYLYSQTSSGGEIVEGTLV